MRFFESEEARREEFPVCEQGVFLAHAAVTVLPRCAARAIQAHAKASCTSHQEFGDVLRRVSESRSLCARLIGARASEIALLGPTSLGLSLFANGLEWHPGDEVLFHGDDYPANVYPWAALADRGVVPKRLRTDVAAGITPEAVEAALTPRTRLVALASCHFLSGRRIDVDAIGRLLRARGILFAVDAIQSLGATSLDVAHVDFLSADAHKWMLGPLAIGIVYVAERNFPLCRPTLLGAWNVKSPEFIAQESIVFEETARRYEPGVLNITGLLGMKASLEMLEDFGPAAVERAVLENRDHLEERLAALGCEFLSPRAPDPLRSGILTARHPRLDSRRLFEAFEKARITVSLRSTRSGERWIRFSPHFYNTPEEMDFAAGVVASELNG